MVTEIPTDLAPELVPLAWVIGSWEGVGVVGYADAPDTQFGQRIDFVAPVGAPFLHYTAQAYTLDDDGKIDSTLTMETGIWQLVRKREAHDAGPGLMVPTSDSPFTTAESVEKLRGADDAFELEVSIVQPHGIMELYTGRVKGPRIDLATDLVARTTTSKEYKSSTRMYGLVEGDLLWAWDMAALGNPLGSHASARLKKVA